MRVKFFLLLLSLFPYMNLCFAKPLFYYGVSSHFFALNNSSDLNKAISTLKANSIRDEVFWSTLTNSNGDLIMSPKIVELKKKFNYAKHNNTCIILILDYGNKAYIQGLPDTEYEIAQFSKYVKYVLSEFKDEVCGVEIWNEWNIGLGRIGEKHRYGSPNDYARLVNLVTPVIRGVNPNWPIVVGALSDMDLNWLKVVLQNVKSTKIDGVSIHPYVFGDRVNTADAVIKHVKNTIDVVNSNYGKNVDIFITEIGWPTFEGLGGVSEKVATDNLIELFIKIRTLREVKGVWWYGLKDKGINPLSKEDNFGLLNFDGSLKETGKAFSALTNALLDCEFANEVDSIYKFKCGTKDVEIYLSTDKKNVDLIKNSSNICDVRNLYDSSNITIQDLDKLNSIKYIAVSKNCS